MSLSCIHRIFKYNSQLEYATLNWHSDIIYITRNLVTVRNRFLHFLSFKFKVKRPQHTEYNGMLSYFNLESLNEKKI